MTSATKTDYIKTCKNCGYYGLIWTKTKFGPRLVYNDGIHKGKIHACDFEILKYEPLPKPD